MIVVGKYKDYQNQYTRSLDSAPLISALFGLVLVEKLPKSLLSALFYLISKSAPSE